MDIKEIEGLIENALGSNTEEEQIATMGKFLFYKEFEGETDIRDIIQALKNVYGDDLRESNAIMWIDGFNEGKVEMFEKLFNGVKMSSANSNDDSEQDDNVGNSNIESVGLEREETLIVEDVDTDNLGKEDYPEVNEDLDYDENLKHDDFEDNHDMEHNEDNLDVDSDVNDFSEENSDDENDDFEHAKNLEGEEKDSVDNFNNKNLDEHDDESEYEQEASK